MINDETMAQKIIPHPPDKNLVNGSQFTIQLNAADIITVTATGLVSFAAGTIIARNNPYKAIPRALLTSIGKMDVTVAPATDPKTHPR